MIFRPLFPMFMSDDAKLTLVHIHTTVMVEQLMGKTMAFIYSDKLYLNTQISVGITFILCVSMNKCITLSMHLKNSMYLIRSMYYYYY